MCDGRTFMKDKSISPSQRKAAATFLKNVRKAIKVEKVRGVRCGVKLTPSKIELTLDAGTDALACEEAWSALDNHNVPRSIRRSQAG